MKQNWGVIILGLLIAGLVYTFWKRGSVDLSYLGKVINDAVNPPEAVQELIRRPTESLANYDASGNKLTAPKTVVDQFGTVV